MESSNAPTIAKRLWHISQVVNYKIRKGISNRELRLDFHFLLKHGKLVGKALSNLLRTFHHHHHHSQTNPKEVEFSCSSTPSYGYYFHSMAKRKSRRHCRDEFDSFDAAEIGMAFQMMNVEESDKESMALPAALSTPSPMMVRELKITNSPFPVDENEVMDAAGMIDEKAEMFIKRFYEHLMREQLASEGANPDYGYRRRTTTVRN